MFKLFQTNRTNMCINYKYIYIYYIIYIYICDRLAPRIAASKNRHVEMASKARNSAWSARAQPVADVKSWDSPHFDEGIWRLMKDWWIIIKITKVEDYEGFGILMYSTYSTYSTLTVWIWGMIFLPLTFPNIPTAFSCTIWMIKPAKICSKICKVGLFFRLTIPCGAAPRRAGPWA